METIREILEKSQEQTSIHLVGQGCIGCSVCRKDISQALLSIRQLIESKMPKKQPPLTQGSNYVAAYNNGFNEAVKLQHQVLEEAFK